MVLLMFEERVVQLGRIRHRHLKKSENVLVFGHLSSVCVSRIESNQAELGHEVEEMVAGELL